MSRKSSCRNCSLLRINVVVVIFSYTSNVSIYNHTSNIDLIIIWSHMIKKWLLDVLKYMCACARLIFVKAALSLDPWVERHQKHYCVWKRAVNRDSSMICHIWLKRFSILKMSDTKLIRFFFRPFQSVVQTTEIPVRRFDTVTLYSEKWVAQNYVYEFFISLIVADVSIVGVL